MIKKKSTKRRQGDNFYYRTAAAQKKYRRLLYHNIGTTVLILIVTMVLAFVWADNSNDQVIETNKTTAEYFINSIGKNISQRMESYTDATHTMSLLIEADHNNGSSRGVEDFYHTLFEDDPAFQSLVLAPDNIITYAYPNIFGPEMEGSDITKTSVSATSLELVNAAITTKHSIMSEPFRFKGVDNDNLVLFTPVYLDRQQTQYWGMIILILNVDEVMDTVKINEFSQAGYAYRLKDINTVTGNETLLRGDLDSSVKDAVSVDFSTKIAQWNISAKRRSGWVTTERRVNTYLTGILASLIMTLMFGLYQSLRRQHLILKYAASMDELTGLKNRRGLRNYYETLGEGTGIVTSLMDVDNFKMINDLYSHEAGDKVLKIFGKLLKEIFGEETAFRYGGDEFLVIAEDISATSFRSKLVLFQHKLVEQIKTEVGIDTHCSAGFVYGNIMEQDTIRRMIHQADICLYEVKYQHKGDCLGKEFDPAIKDEKAILKNLAHAAKR